MDLNYLDNITGLEFEKFALTILEYEARKLGKKIVLDKETSEYLYSHYLGVINHGFLVEYFDRKYIVRIDYGDDDEKMERFKKSKEFNSSDGCCAW